MSRVASGGTSANAGQQRVPQNRTIGLKMISVKSARHVKEHLVAIEFSDGLSSVIDFSDTIGK
jgi:hypothetical protein